MFFETINAHSLSDTDRQELEIKLDVAYDNLAKPYAFMCGYHDNLIKYRDAVNERIKLANDNNGVDMSMQINFFEDGDSLFLRCGVIPCLELEIDEQGWSYLGAPRKKRTHTNGCQ
jgi:hypothetical protein